MSSTSELSRSKEYISFRSSVPLRKIVVDSDGMKGWKVYDSGPKTIKCPLFCLPPVSGTADIFFKQILSLAAKGYRVISTEPPTYWSVKEWCDGFKKLLDYMELDRVHIFGASLGGFLAQKFAEINSHCPRVVSLILCNTFIDTSVFSYSESALLFWILPSLVLKKMIMGNFAAEKADSEIVDAIDFMVERLDSLTQGELASRLTMNCITNYVQPQKMGNLPITIIDVFDEYALSNVVREEMYKCYPEAKLAHLKNGGNFPYLSRSADVNLYLQLKNKFSGNDLNPENWGWTKTETMFLPVRTTDKLAPDELLKLVHCNCLKNCLKRCGCRKVGLPCSSLCKHCKGESCDNCKKIAMEYDNDQFDDVDEGNILQNENEDDSVCADYAVSIGQFVDTLLGDEENDANKTQEETDDYEPPSKKRSKE